VVDAYCGVGLHARRLARQGADVCAIELDPLAAAEARRAIPGGTVVTARVEEVLAEQLPADLVVVNPPRAGLHEGVVAALAAQPPGRIIYISCDPATLARDTGRLASLFEVRSIRCFDLFPQTAHVETVLEMKCSIT
jgi:23S rRNA (uracil1939-C5)-methyltransferase